MQATLYMFESKNIQSMSKENVLSPSK